MYKIKIKRSVIGIEKDVIQLILKKSRNGDKTYTVKEGILRDFIEGDGLSKLNLNLNQKILNLSEDFIDIDLDDMYEYLECIKSDSNLVNLIELQEPNNRAIFIIGFGNVIKIHGGESTPEEDEVIEKNFLFYSLNFLFNLNLNIFSPIISDESLDS